MRSSPPARRAAPGARGPSARRRRAWRARRDARHARPAHARRPPARSIVCCSLPSVCARIARACATCASAACSSTRARADDVACELPPCLQDLALQALVQLGGFGLALERPQPAARLALDVERAVEVLLRALELQLRAAPALAVLAEPGRLLDQQPPLARLGGHDRLDATLRDDRVGLLPETGVGEHLDHVGQPAARAVQAITAVAVAVEPAHDRDLAQRQVHPAVGVIQHDLHLGRRAWLHAAATAEDHVLHRLAAHRERRLLAHRPQHRVGHVGLARAVRPDDHAHARPEVQLGAVGERLEAVQRQRLQPHEQASAAP